MLLNVQYSTVRFINHWAKVMYLSIRFDFSDLRAALSQLGSIFHTICKVMSILNTSMLPFIGETEWLASRQRGGEKEKSVELWAFHRTFCLWNLCIFLAINFHYNTHVAICAESQNTLGSHFAANMSVSIDCARYAAWEVTRTSNV